MIKNEVNLMKNTKSQAALEFIMTYGWAILVVLVAIGALAYFGVLSPDRFLPNKCTFQAGIACLDHKATSTTLDINVRNSLGYDITINNLKANSCTSITPGTTLSNGGTATYTFTTCTISGSKYSGDVNFTYTNIETNVQHVNQGRVTSRVE